MLFSVEQITNWKRRSYLTKAKPYEISKENVWKAYKQVKAKGGAQGADGQTIKDFEKKLKLNLYKIWNRMSSGSYIPPAVRAVEIPKKDGTTRVLGVPSVSDRIAQMVVKLELEPQIEPYFHKDSYGYRPGKSAIEAISETRKRFERYCDDIIVHVRTENEAEMLKVEMEIRFNQCGLELHPDKTNIVYCKDSKRRKEYHNTSFDFLGYTFQSRESRNRQGKYFVGFCRQ